VCFASGAAHVCNDLQPYRKAFFKHAQVLSELGHALENAAELQKTTQSTNPKGVVVVIKN
jgi:hypothetical protein